jgi:hypothetical protein
METKKHKPQLKITLKDKIFWRFYLVSEVTATTTNTKIKFI